LSFLGAFFHMASNTQKWKKAPSPGDFPRYPLELQKML